MSLTRFSRSKSGATAIEYALICAILAMGIIASVSILRDDLSAKLMSVSALFG